MNSYAKSKEKRVDDLTDDEIMFVIDKVADLLISEMMNLLMESQSVPELLEATHGMELHEDFDENVVENYDKIDFERKWNHLRTKLGAPLSLDELIETESSLLAYEIEYIENAAVQAEYEKLEAEFLLTLKNTDRKIYLMKKDKMAQKEIAHQLGFKTHSAVTKRIAGIKESLEEFLKDRN